MLERKNIDRVFQENLKDLEIYPSGKVWDHIELDLNEKRLKRTISLWQRLSGVAVIFMLFFAGGALYYNSTQSVNQSVSRVDIENKVPGKQQIENSQGDLVLIEKEKKNEKVAKVKEESIFVKTPENKVVITSESINSVYENVENKYIINQDQLIEDLRSNKNIVANSEPVNLKEKSISSNSKKWAVGPTVAPVYYNSLTNGSPLNESLMQNSRSSDEALSIGFKVNYQLSDKINIQSGVNKVELAYTTYDVNAVISSSKFVSNNMNTDKPGVVLSPSSANYSRTLSPNENDLNKSSLKGELNQSLEYFEFPLELKYNLYDSRVGLNLVGGFSTFFLTNNSVSLTSQNRTTDLGNANNLNSVNFSGNLGIDLDYKLNKSWYLNVAPMFKYQFNTFSNNSGNFQPYYFGVYSGLNYRF